MADGVTVRMAWWAYGFTYRNYVGGLCVCACRKHSRHPFVHTYLSRVQSAEISSYVYRTETTVSPYYHTLYLYCETCNLLVCSYCVLIHICVMHPSPSGAVYGI